MLCDFLMGMDIVTANPKGTAIDKDEGKPDINLYGSNESNPQF